MRTFALMVMLLALVGFARGDDTDPEPPGSGAAALRKLKGKWNSVRLLIKGAEKEYTTESYTFDGDKVTYNTGKTTRKMTVKLDKNRPDTFELTPEDNKAALKTMRNSFKIEKGELYLMPNRSTDAKVKPDFSGKSGPVLILKPEKK
jgi:uncharacterized protein (TIGR03067 family)